MPTSTQTGILYTNYYCPPLQSIDKVLTLLHKSQTEIEEFRTTSGISKVAIEEEKDELEMAKTLLDEYISSSSIDVNDITHLIYCTGYYGKTTMRDNVCIPYYLKEKYGFKNAAVLFLGYSCAAMMEAIHVGHALVESGRGKSVVIISVLKIHDLKQRFIEVSMIGDGAGIVVIGKGPARYKLIDSSCSASGRFSISKGQNINMLDRLPIIKGGVENILTILQKNKIEKEEVRWLVPLNLSVEGYKIYAEILEIPFEKVYLENLAHGGHISDVDTPRNLTCLYKNAESMLRTGDKIVVYGAGLVNFDVSYGVNILEY